MNVCRRETSAKQKKTQVQDLMQANNWFCCKRGQQISCVSNRLIFEKKKSHVCAGRIPSTFTSTVNKEQVHETKTWKFSQYHACFPKSERSTGLRFRAPGDISCWSVAIVVVWNWSQRVVLFPWPSSNKVFVCGKPSWICDLSMSECQCVGAVWGTGKDKPISIRTRMSYFVANLLCYAGRCRTLFLCIFQQGDIAFLDGSATSPKPYRVLQNRIELCLLLSASFLLWGTVPPVAVPG